VLALVLLEHHRQRPHVAGRLVVGVALQVAGQVLELDLAPAGQDGGVLEGVLELAHVAGEG
jgi:hypothetical protein